MARGDQLLRAWKLLNLLQKRGDGLTLAELAEELGVSKRTIQRDFEALAEVGFPLDHVEDDYGRRLWKLPHDTLRSGALVLSHTEALSLALAGRMFEPVAGTHLAEGIQSAIEKVRSSLHRKALDFFADVDVLTYIPRFGQADHAGHAPTIRALIEAARNRATVSLGYRPVWQPDRRPYVTKFDPYGLVLFDGNLFVLGHSHRSKATRILKVLRITSLETTRQTFRRPDIDIRRHFEDSFGIVTAPDRPIAIKVRFTGRAVDLVSERIWHKSQKLEWPTPEPTLFEPASGYPQSVVATFRLAEVGVFKGWLKSFGECAEVISPKSLRDEMRDELLAAARLYQT